VRLPLTLGRGLAVAVDGTRPFEGVLVLGVDAPEVAADASCFVGDLVGDLGHGQYIESNNCLGHTRRMLEGLEVGLDVLVAGLGLAAFMLIRVPAPASGTVLNLLPGPGKIALDGLPTLLAGPLLLGAWGNGVGCVITVTAAGLRNIPFPIRHSKYLSPCTLPSFFPLSSSSSTPTQSPVEKWGCPI
jgi:hypothetical protein